MDEQPACSWVRCSAVDENGHRCLLEEGHYEEGGKGSLATRPMSLHEVNPWEISNGHTWTFDGVCLTCGLPEQDDPPYCKHADQPAGPCTTRTEAGQFVGDPCQDCGHTNLVHPGRHNPALDACAICALGGPRWSEPEIRAAFALSRRGTAGSDAAALEDLIDRLRGATRGDTM